LLVILYRILPFAASFLRDHRRWLIAGPPLPRTDEFHHRRAARLVATIARLGPSFVKLGQIFGGRADLLPEAYAAELSRLTDQVPPAPFAAVRRVIEDQMGGSLDRVFTEFESTPIAAGSLGQVYRAKYQGREVAVKVLRPGVEDLVRRDLAIARRLVRWLVQWVPNAHTRGAQAVLDEFGVRIWDEMDFDREAANLRMVRANFAGNRRVRIPAVFDEISGPRVLVLEYVDGVRIDALDPQRVYGGLRVSGVVERLVELYLEMMLSHGLFHADPHPGNLLVAPDGVLVLLDFGVLIPVSRERRRHLFDASFAAIRGDAVGVADAMFALGIVEPGAERAQIERLARLLLDINKGRTTTQERIELLTNEILDELYDWPIRLPSDLVYYGRTASLIEGIGIRYDARFNPVQAATPALFRMRGRLLTSVSDLRLLDQLDLPTAIGFALGKATAMISNVGARLLRFAREELDQPPVPTPKELPRRVGAA
jgi:predicted unusual protein kinase regulating ubiquinone biosynthesis (AarF/ABC1/UbiB family)